MNALPDARLFEKPDEKRDYYRITDTGLAYLDGTHLPALARG